MSLFEFYVNRVIAPRLARPPLISMDDYRHWNSRVSSRYLIDANFLFSLVNHSNCLHEWGLEMGISTSCVWKEGEVSGNKYGCRGCGPKNPRKDQLEQLHILTDGKERECVWIHDIVASRLKIVSPSWDRTRTLFTLSGRSEGVVMVPAPWLPARYWGPASN